MSVIKELFQYREMVFSLVRQNLRSRYKGSVLGFLWTFINPLLQLVVYTIVFSNIMRSGIEHYAMFLFVALIPWLFFSASLTGGSSCILMNKDLVKKIYFPRRVIPISYVTSAFVNMLLGFVVVFGALFFSGIGVNGYALLYLPAVMIVEYIFSMGIAIFFSAFTVYFRDLEYILGIISMAWMYMTPVMYPDDKVPEKYRVLFNLNPMTSIIKIYRDILYYKQIPDLGVLGQALISGIIFLVAGNVTFGILEKRFAEEI